MAKSIVLKKNKEEIEDFDFSDLMEEACSHDDEFMAGMMSNVIEASNKQTGLAIELTRLVVESSEKTMNENEVFSIFRKASEVIAEKSPLKELWEKFSERE